LRAKRKAILVLLGVVLLAVTIPVFKHLQAELVPAQEAQAAPAGRTDQASLRAILAKKGIPSPIPNLWILVDKSDHTLSLFSGDTWLKSYHVELGDGGWGDKRVAGDHRTPEGRFYVCQRTVISPPDYYLGSRWLRLSYPNAEHARRGLAQGLIDQSTYNAIMRALAYRAVPPQYTALGGGIGIHGGDIPSFSRDWTWGCVGMSNRDVEEIYDYVGIGTQVIIKP